MQTDEGKTAMFRTGISVALLYIVFLFLVFGGFSGYISRVNLEEGLTPKVGNLDTLIFRGTREAELRQDLIHRRQNFSETNVELRKTEIQELEYDGMHHVLSSRPLELFLPISTKIIENREILTSKFVELFNGVYLDDELYENRKAELLAQVLVTTTFVEDAPGELRASFTKDVETTLKLLSERELEIVKLKVSREEWRKKKESLESDKKLLLTEIEELESKLSKTSEKIDDEHRAIIASFKNSLGGIPYFFLQIPTIILTLLVTLATGGLGSVVAFTRKFLRGHTGTGTGRLLVNVSEGVAAAVAIFF